MTARDPRPFTPRYRPQRLDGENAPLSRYVVLPGDPPALARFLAAEADAHGEGLPEDWPQERQR